MKKPTIKDLIYIAAFVIFQGVPVLFHLTKTWMFDKVEWYYIFAPTFFLSFLFACVVAWSLVSWWNIKDEFNNCKP